MNAPRDTLLGGAIGLALGLCLILVAKAQGRRMIRRFFAWLFRGPQCAACDAREVTMFRAESKGWRVNGLVPGGNVCWLCSECLSQESD